MELVTYLAFNGQCAEAFKAYEKILKGQIVFSTTYGETPGHENVADDVKKRIMHITLKVGNATLQGADTPGPYSKPAGFSVTIQLDNEAEADRIFAELSEGGQIRMPIDKTFWAKRFGMLIDRFNIPWMVNCGG